MKYKEFGADNHDVILFLHGGGLSWWNYREEAELLQAQYHVVLPILDGHGGSDRPFTSIEENAAELIAFIDEQFGGSVLMIGGLSLGAQILLEMLSQRSDICKYALVESAAVLPSKLTHALIGTAVSSSYGLIKNRSFAKKQFKALKIKEELFEDYYRDTCLIQKADMIAFMKANAAYALKDSICGCTAEVHVFAGEKETKEIRESVKAIKKALPECQVKILDGMYHGEFSLNYAKEYVRTVEEILEGKV